ncbi:hypothetical protein, partial [Sebaldella sp. S0638]|uniref:hypothetical protein n=1 Tax=Sebaldella sp. S0638 TaxID=2957809 RepID=UPI00209DC571
MENKDLNERVKIHGQKICSKCGEPYPTMKEYFYKTTGTKDGLRSDCKRCQDTQKLRREISHLKELDTVSIGEAKEAEIKELKKVIDTGNTEKENLVKIITMTDERNETLSDTAAKFSEKYKKSRKWNYALGVCL